MPRSFVLTCGALLIATSLNPIAAAQVTYEVTFTSDWSLQTHAGAFPPGAHFSPLIGGTHSDAVSYWEPGGIASNAIEQMAETGGTSQLRNQVNGHINAGHAGQVVQGGLIFAPDSTSTTFTVSAEHPLLTLVTMIAPSPDWFVGVSGLDFRQDGQWIETLSLDLGNYDAGTDAGPNFTSTNQDVTPHEPISMLGAPLEGFPPIGNFTFDLIDPGTALCDFDQSGSCDTDDLDNLLGVGPIADGVAVMFGTNQQFDLNGDGMIDLADRDEWLVGAAAENGFTSAYSPADANLDGTTDALDFIAWNDNKFSPSLAASEGDFNGDGAVDGLDFIVWNDSKFQSSDVSAIPEPTSLLFVFAFLAMARRLFVMRPRCES